MQIEYRRATPDQAAAIEAIHAKRMATALLSGEAPADLGDDVSCAIRLACCGFGERLIAALLPLAQEIARQRVAAARIGFH